MVRKPDVKGSLAQENALMAQGTFIYGDHGSVGASNTLQVKFLLLLLLLLLLTIMHDDD